MYSLLPAVIACVFLGLGVFVVNRKGYTRVSVSFLLLCVTTFFWQSTWAVLFQTKNAILAMFLIRFGYFFILFLPTSLYHFLTEISETNSDRIYVYSSYVFSGVLGIVLLTTDLFVSGFYTYFWGYYPEAGPLHFLHILQTSIVVFRGLYITWIKQNEVHHFQRTRLLYCIASSFVYFLAAVDYLCNYGIEFYPPGVIFILVSLSIMALAIIKYGLMDNPAALAASIAHEMRTPLATIQLQAKSIANFLPELFQGYQIAVDNQLFSPSMHPHHFERLKNIAFGIEREVKQSHMIIDITLASAHGDLHKNYRHRSHSIADCVVDTVENYPFNKTEKRRITLHLDNDFHYIGSDILMKYVLYNLIKNSLYEIGKTGVGDVTISLEAGNVLNKLVFTDTGPGIVEDLLPHIFDNFFTTKQEGSGTGMGLAFCRRVMASFNGNIECHSRIGKFTTFTLTFPVVNGPHPLTRCDRMEA
jgi:two-component system, CAI-1 autoinducer sensor kinase/phosphatase CqsS